MYFSAECRAQNAGLPAEGTDLQRSVSGAELIAQSAESSGIAE